MKTALRITWAGSAAASFLSDVTVELRVRWPGDRKGEPACATMPRFRITHLAGDSYELSDRATWDKTYHGSLASAQAAAEAILAKEGRPE
jgi:hypothetical protein